MTYELRKIVGDVEYRSIKGVKLLRGYGAVYESLSQNLGGFVEKFTRGAFAEYISHNPDVLGLRNHDLDQLLARTANPAGTMKVKSDKTGLQYRIVPNLEDPVAVSTVAQVERGDLRGSSVGFLVVPGDESVSWGFTDQGFPLREIHQAQVRDTGPVTTPAYTDTTAAAQRALAELAELRSLGYAEVRTACEEGSLCAIVKAGDGASPPPVDLIAARHFAAG